MTLRRGLFRIWLALTMLWLLALGAFVTLSGAQSWLSAIGLVLLLGIYSALGALVLGKLALWIARGFTSHPALKASFYERSVTNLVLVFAALGAVSNVYGWGMKSQWSGSMTRFLASALGGVVSVGALGLLIGLFAYRKRRQIAIPQDQE